MKKMLLFLACFLSLGGTLSLAQLAFATAGTDTILTNTFRDDNGDGTVERIRWVMDTGVNTCTYDPADWTVNNAGSLNVSITGISCSGPNIYINVTADANETGATTNPVISYANSGTADSVTLTVGPMGSHSNTTAADGAAPYYLSGSYANPSLDGTYLTLSAVFTEPVTYSGCNTNDWNFTGHSLGATLVFAPCDAGESTVNSNTISLDTIYVLDADSHTNTGVSGGTEPELQYLGGTNQVHDAASNNAAVRTLSLTDHAKPVIRSTSYRDTDHDGKIDTVDFEFSEFVSASSEISASDLSFNSVGDFTGASFGSSALDRITSYVTSTLITLNSSVTAYDTHDDASAQIQVASGTFQLIDGSAAANTFTGPQTINMNLDEAAPAVYKVDYLDNTGSDGKVDAVKLYFSEPIDSSTSSVSANDLTLLSVGDFTGAAFGANATNLVTPSISDLIVPLGTATSVVDTHDDLGTFAVDFQNAFLLEDTSLRTTDQSQQHSLTGTDGAAPILISASPVDGAIDVVPTANIVDTFSEPMSTDTSAMYIQKSDFTGPHRPFVASWAVGNTELTINPVSSLACSTEYFALLVLHDAYDVGFNYGDSPLFTTAATGCPSGGGSGSTSTTPATYTIDITTPTGSESLAVGSALELKWTTGGTGTTAYVNLYYTTDDGSTWTELSHNTANDGSYAWTIPSSAAGKTIKVKADGTDLVDVLATDTSAGVKIAGTATTTPTPTPTPTPSTAPTVPNGYGISPVTGLQEPLSQVHVGQYIKGASLPTVYYLDPNGTRRPFLNEQVYFSWAASFSQISLVTDATLPTIPMGSPVIPRPGVVLVKIVSSPKVYAVEPADATSTKGILRWIPSETVAKTVYGTDWSDYIIDIPDTIISKYTYGADLTADYVKATNMKKRSALHN